MVSNDALTPSDDIINNTFKSLKGCVSECPLNSPLTANQPLIGWPWSSGKVTNVLSPSLVLEECFCHSWPPIHDLSWIANFINILDSEFTRSQRQDSDVFRGREFMMCFHWSSAMMIFCIGNHMGFEPATPEFWVGQFLSPCATVPFLGWLLLQFAF